MVKLMLSNRFKLKKINLIFSVDKLYQKKEDKIVFRILIMICGLLGFINLKNL